MIALSLAIFSLIFSLLSLRAANKALRHAREHLALVRARASIKEA